jgi:hypothetical protein
LVKVEFRDTDDNKEIIKTPKNLKRSEETKALISSRLRETFANAKELKEHRMNNAQQQHLITKLKRYEGVEIDGNIENYIHPVMCKKTHDVKFYKVKINGVVTKFHGKHMSTEALKEKAVEFLQTLKQI